MKVGYQSCLLKVMGWWAFDVFTQLSAQKPNLDSDIAGQTVLRNIGLYTFMIPFGLANATTFLTGTYIGQGKI